MHYSTVFIYRLELKKCTKSFVQRKTTFVCRLEAVEATVVADYVWQ